VMTGSSAFADDDRRRMNARHNDKRASSRGLPCALRRQAASPRVSLGRITVRYFRLAEGIAT
jgi:hypothetical protein